MDWKEQVGKTFSDSNIIRVDYLNKQLDLMVKEWTDYIKEFNGISVDVTKDSVLEGGNLFSQFKIVIDSTTMGFPFKIEVGYKLIRNQGIGLELKYAEDIDLRKAFKESPSEKADYHIYSVDEFTEAEIFEKDYVIQLCNNRYMTWIEKMKRVGNV